MPAVIVKKRITRELYVIHVSQEIKQRITGSRNQKFVAWIAQQTEDERVSFAGARSENQIIDRNAFAVFSVVIAHGLTGRYHAFWIRTILQRCGSTERTHDGWCVILEAAFSGIGRAEIKQASAAGFVLLQSFG